METWRKAAGLKTMALLLAIAVNINSPAQTLQTIYTFPTGSPSALTFGTNGLLYGASYGPGGNGAIFSITTNGALTNFATFPATNNADPNGLIQALDGNFYGPAFAVSVGPGLIFQATAAGGLKTFAKLPGSAPVYPSALLQGRDGNFYGTTFYGGAINGNFPDGMGAIFRVTTNGVYSTLASFGFTNGATPAAGLIIGPDGNFYGTTQAGGKTNATFKTGMGTIFRFTTNGALALVAAFDQTNGATPRSPLVINGDGNFYGTAYRGGMNDKGSVFQLTTNGVITAIALFAGTNGANPDSITTGPLGDLYGTTYAGGMSANGTLFAVTTNGALTMLAVFTGTNGAHPTALTLGSDGNFYGTTTNTVFRLGLGPTITLQPLSLNAYAGATVVFAVSAAGSGSLSFQWQKNGTNLTDGGTISGSATTNLTITAVVDGDAGSYTVIVSDSEGSTPSTVGTLTINDGVFFVSEPLSQTVGAGSTVTFSTAVYGDPPFIFQWSLNGSAFGSPVGSSNFSTLVLTNVGTNQSGNYTVTVFNPVGSLTSSNALLTVVPQPALSLQLSAGYPLLALRGTVGDGFVVQYSTNLGETNWLNLISITNLSNSPFTFLDSAPTTQPARFYRASVKQ